VALTAIINSAAENTPAVRIFVNVAEGQAPL